MGLGVGFSVDVVGGSPGPFVVSRTSDGRLSAFIVISANALLCCCGSSGEAGDSEGRGGTSGTRDGLRLARLFVVLPRFRGDALFVGDEGSLGAMDCSGSKI